MFKVAQGLHNHPVYNCIPPGQECSWHRLLHRRNVISAYKPMDSNGWHLLVSLLMWNLGNDWLPIYKVYIEHPPWTWGANFPAVQVLNSSFQPYSPVSRMERYAKWLRGMGLPYQHSFLLVWTSRPDLPVASVGKQDVFAGIHWKLSMCLMA